MASSHSAGGGGSQSTAVDLGFDPLALPGRLGQEIERPAERARRRLVAGADEGDDVVLDLLGIDSPSGPSARKQQRQEILGRRVSALPSPPRGAR